MAVTGTLEQIRNKVRLLTGRPSTNQLSNPDLDNYINDFYVYDLPAHLKLWNLTGAESPLATTNTSGDRILTEGRWLYNIDWNQYTNIEPLFYVGGYEISFFQDIRSFLNFFPSQMLKQTLATGTGVLGPYTGTVSNTPLLYDSVLITVIDNTGNTLTAGVDADGTIDGDVAAGGTINLTTGAMAGLTWTAIIPVGNIMTVQSLTYVQTRPQAVLYFNKALIFYPVPDVAYDVTCTVNYAPSEMEAGDQPEIREWWTLIAFGAALKIFQDNLDVESYQKVKMFFDKQLCLVERRTLKQLSTQRVATIYDGGSGISGYQNL